MDFAENQSYNRKISWGTLYLYQKTKQQWLTCRNEIKEVIIDLCSLNMKKIGNLSNLAKSEMFVANVLNEMQWSSLWLSLRQQVLYWISKDVETGSVSFIKHIFKEPLPPPYQYNQCRDIIGSWALVGLATMVGNFSQRQGFM